MTSMMGLDFMWKKPCKHLNTNFDILYSNLYINPAVGAHNMTTNCSLEGGICKHTECEEERITNYEQR